MSKYKAILHYSDGSHEEFDQLSKNESDAIAWAQSGRLSYKLGYRLSPGGNRFDGKGNISYEIVEIDD